MKKVVIIADTHLRLGHFPSLINIMNEADYIICAGDAEYDYYSILKEYGDKLIICRGNCDIGVDFEREIVTTIEGIRILITHGHTLSVKSGLDKLYYRASELDCTLAIYGHTHIAETTKCERITLVNSGAIYGHNPSYAYLTLHNGKFFLETIYLNGK